MAEARKRCDCANGAPNKFEKQRRWEACEHPWRMRIKPRGGKAMWINLTETYPDDDLEVAIAKANVAARKGKLVTRPVAASCRYVAAKYVESRGNKKHYYLDVFLKKIGDTPMDDVTTAEIKEIIAAWMSRKKARAGVQRGAVAERHLKQSARHFFNWAIAEGYATRTPFKTLQGVTLIKVKTTKGRSRRLEEGEEARILDAAQADPYVADFFTAIIETSCRPGELRTLQWSEVRGDEIVLLAAKTKDREERRVPIMPTLRAILDRRKRGPDRNDLPPAAYVFGDETGLMMSKEKLSERWRKICAAANVKDLHLHDLRAEGASQLSEAGVPTEQVRDALGHSSITMTNNYLRSRARGLHKAYRQRAAKQARERLRRVK